MNKWHKTRENKSKDNTVIFISFNKVIRLIPRNITLVPRSSSSICNTCSTCMTSANVVIVNLILFMISKQHMFSNLIFHDIYVSKSCLFKANGSS